MPSCRCALLLLTLAFPSVHSRCAIVQDDINDCPLPWPTDPAQTRCVPRPAGWSADGTDRSAELHAHTFVPFNNTPGDPTTYVPNVCPQFPEVCCSDYQMCARAPAYFSCCSAACPPSALPLTLHPRIPPRFRNSLHINFKGIWAAFGDIAGGGCPGCYQNVVNFWCGYTCAPNQSDFVAFLGTADKVDPVSQGTYTVALTETAIDTDYACAANFSVFGSCASTGKVQEFSPLQTCEGFFDYQGQTEAIQTGLSFMTFNYSSSGSAPAANSSLSWPLYSCCNFPASITSDSPLPWPPSPADGPNMSCPCATCAGMCSGGQCRGGSASGAYAGLDF